MALSRRLDMPDIIKNAPEIHFGLEIFQEAFADLNRDRDLGFGALAPIKRRDIRHWLRERDLLDGDLETSMIHHIEAMDAHYRDWAHKAMSRKTPEVGRGRTERIIQQPRKGTRKGHPKGGQ